jgi:LysM repeat protein
MVRRSRARYLAPIALAAVIAGTYLVVHDAMSKKHAPPPSQAQRSHRRHRKVDRSKFYVVKPGDNLTSIARATGVGISTIEALNPRIDPNALQTGQRLRLRR